MELKEILAVSGTPGLYRYVAQGKGGIIVESLSDGRRTMVGGTTKVSALGDIAIFTASGEMPLGDLFQTLYDRQGGQAVEVTAKSTPDELRAFMSSILPDYDTERVHQSDMKKIAQWYNLLVAAGMTSFKATEATAEGGESVSEAPKPAKTTKTGTKTAAKSSSATQRTPKVSGAKTASVKNTTARKAQ
ncbi:DUF5606 domain-containing protein [uncultured Rikenella sp.]|uniref:DUF5606 family protein n=1 Tax=uncultured Rikenella sp. TaxID=368003 RepID=UPI0034172A59